MRPGLLRPDLRTTCFCSRATRATRDSRRRSHTVLPAQNKRLISWAARLERLLRTALEPHLGTCAYRLRGGRFRSLRFLGTAAGLGSIGRCQRLSEQLIYSPHTPHREVAEDVSALSHYLVVVRRVARLKHDMLDARALCGHNLSLDTAYWKHQPPQCDLARHGSVAAYRPARAE